MARVSVDDCRLMDLPRMLDPRGSLTFIEGGKHVPFDIKRIFYIYDVPTAESRGAHAHRALSQFLVCLGGGFDVALDDGRTRRLQRLNRPWQGLLIPPMIWAAEVNFDPGSLCMVLASDIYLEKDYIRDRDEYLKAVEALP
jgi:hypothetical protein